MGWIILYISLAAENVADLTVRPPVTTQQILIF